MSTHLDKTVKQFLESLQTSSKHHTLCLIIQDPTFTAENPRDQLKAMGKDPAFADQPTPTELGELLTNLKDKIAVVNFEDLDKNPKCIDLLHTRAQQDAPGGKLVIVSRHWNSRNTEKEREIWKGHCLFYELAAPAKPRKT